MTHFVTCRLVMPNKKLFIRRDAFCRTKGHCGCNDVPRGFWPVCQTKQPIGTDTQSNRYIGGQLRVGQAGLVILKELTNR